MKNLAASMLAVLMLTPAVKATVQTNLVYQESYTQTSAGASKSGQSVSASVYLDTTGTPEDTAESVVAFRPDGSEMNLIFTSPNPGLPFYLWVDLYYPPQDAPFGDYTFAFTGGTRDGTDETLTLDPRQLPPAISELTIHSFESLSKGDVSKPIRLVFRPSEQQGRGPNMKNAANELSTKLAISNGEGEPVFEVPAFDPRTPTLVIPAGTLKPANSYSFSLHYITEFFTSSAHIVYVRQLDFVFVTAAAKPQ